MENPHPPWDQLALAYPQLARSSKISHQKAAFLAGYACHLRADWVWVTDIFEPFFGLQAGWSTFRERLYLHNVLRSYMDCQILEPVRRQAHNTLENVTLNGWLPFAQDTHLETWRDLLAGQLQPGARIQTVEVFASRQGIPPTEYYDLLNSEQALESAVFSHLPRDLLDAYLGNLLADNVLFLQDYLSEITGPHL